MIPSEMKERNAQYEESWNSQPETQAELTPIKPDPEDPFALGWQDGEKVAGDGVSMQTHRAMKEAGVGPYGGEVVVSDAGGPGFKDQVGSTTLQNESGLRTLLSKRGVTSKSEQDAWIDRYKKTKGLH